MATESVVRNDNGELPPLDEEYQRGRDALRDYLSAVQRVLRDPTRSVDELLAKGDWVRRELGHAEMLEVGMRRTLRILRGANEGFEEEGLHLVRSIQAGQAVNCSPAMGRWQDATVPVPARERVPPDDSPDC